jgi:hypothetical protein
MANSTLYRVALLFLTGIAVCIFDAHRPTAWLRGSSDSTKTTRSTEQQEKIHTPMQPPPPSLLPELNLSPRFDFLANATSSLSSSSQPANIIPILHSLPRSGGATISAILGQCQGLVLAGEYTSSTQDDSKLSIVNHGNSKHVTPVDLSTASGRQRAQSFGLTNMADVLISHDLRNTSEVFTSFGPAGALWVWFRNPIHRQASLFHYLTSLSSDHPDYNSYLSVYGLADFARSKFHESNAMLKSLLGRPTSPSLGWTMSDVLIAKELLRQKAHVGLLETKGDSLHRLLRSIGKASQRECTERLLDWAWPHKSRTMYMDALDESSEAYQVLLQNNWLDMELYNYATFLFRQQGERS